MNVTDPTQHRLGFTLVTGDADRLQYIVMFEPGQHDNALATLGQRLPTRTPLTHSHIAGVRSWMLENEQRTAIVLTDGHRTEFTFAEFIKFMSDLVRTRFRVLDVQRFTPFKAEIILGGDLNSMVLTFRVNISEGNMWAFQRFVGSNGQPAPRAAGPELLRLLEASPWAISTKLKDMIDFFNGLPLQINKTPITPR